MKGKTMKKILIVDVKDENRYMLRALLIGNKFEVREAENGDEALKIARTSPPDLIISDILMPVMDGFSLCRQWKKEELLINIPFIFYTATFTEPKDVKFGLNLGADKYLIKPMDPDDLIQIIKEIFEKPKKGKQYKTKESIEERLFLKEYNGTLIQKLEDKLLQLEKDNDLLRREVEKKNRSEKALRESEAKYIDLYENAPDMHASIDAKTALVIRCNQTLADKTGYSKAEIVGQPVFNLYHPDCMDEVKKAFQQFVKTGTIRDKELQVKRKDGSKIEVSLNVSAVKDEDGNIIYSWSSWRDITKYKQTERITHEQTRLLDLIFKHSLDCIVLLDKEYNFIRVSEAYAKACQRKSSEFPGHNHFEFYPSKFKDDAEDVKNKKYIYQKSARPFIFPDHPEWGTTYWDLGLVPILDEGGEVELFLFTLKDVTERQIAEENLRTEKEFTDIALDTQLDTFFLFEPATGNALRWNKTFRDIVGYTDEEIAKLPAPASYHSPDDLKRAGIFIQEVLSKGNGTIRLELICKDGHKVPTEYSVSVINDDQGKPKYFISIGRDITEHLRAEKQLMQSESRLKEAQRLAQIGHWELELVSNKLTWSEETYRIFNIKPGEFGGSYEAFLETVHPDDRDAVNKAYRDSLKSRIPYEIIHRLLFKDGMVKFVHERCKTDFSESGEPLRSLGTVQDITERMQAEEAIKESEQKYRRLVESLERDYIIYSHDTQGIFTYLSPSIINVLGYTQDEFIGHYAEYMTDSPINKDVERYTNAGLQGEKQPPYEAEFWHKNGSRIHLEVTEVPVFDKEGNVLSIEGIVHDITERKQVDKKLRNQEKVLSDILEVTLSGYWDWNIPENTEYLSPAFKKMFGYEDHELPNTPESWQKLIFQEDLPGVLECFDRHVKSHGKEPYHNEVRYWHKNGSIVWVLCAGRVIEWTDDGSPIRMVACHVDITQRKQADEQYRGILQTAIDGFWIVDASNGQFLDVNEAYCRMIGYTRNELLDMKIANIEASESSIEVKEHMARIIKSGTDVRFETKHRCKDGNIIDVQVSTQYMEERNIFITFVQDITDRKKTENELERHREHLEEMVAERTSELAAINKELEDFNYSVSHDLRAPLRAISGFSEIIAKCHSVNLNEEGKHYFDNIVQASNNMDALIKDLLEYSHLGRKEIYSRPIELSDIFDKVVKNLTGKLNETKAQFNRPKNLPTIHGEQNLLIRIFTNLFENAITYRRPEIPLKLAVTCKTENDFTIVGVRDNGMGIPLEYQNKIFKVFQKLHNQDEYPGTGIGLALVKKSVELLGGNVWVESEVGKGSTFFLKLKKQGKSDNRLVM